MLPLPHMLHSPSPQKPKCLEKLIQAITTNFQQDFFHIKEIVLLGFFLSVCLFYLFHKMETDQSDIIHLRHSDLLGSVENWLYYFPTLYFWMLLKIGLITPSLFHIPQK